MRIYKAGEELLCGAQRQTDTSHQGRPAVVSGRAWDFAGQGSPQGPVDVLQDSAILLSLSGV